MTRKPFINDDYLLTKKELEKQVAMITRYNEEL